MWKRDRDPFMLCEAKDTRDIYRSEKREMVKYIYTWTVEVKKSDGPCRDIRHLVTKPSRFTSVCVYIPFSAHIRAQVALNESSCLSNWTRCIFWCIIERE